MTGEKLKEFMRRLNAEEYICDLDTNGAGTIRGSGSEYVTINEDGEIFYKPEYRRLAFDIRDIRDEVDEYMTEFGKAAPDVERFPNGGKEDTRTLMLYNGAELAARQLSNGSMDFVTWVNARGHRDMGHYHTGYAAAKEDFAIRAGLIDRNRFFTETELTVIRSNLSDYLAIDGGECISGDDERAMKNIIGKIDNVVAPEIQEQAQEAEDQGYEPEQEL